MARLRDFFRGLCEETWELNRQMVMSLVDTETDTILDCGCDDGEFTERVARYVMARNVIGIEVDKYRASMAAERGIEVISEDLNRNFKLDNSIADAVIPIQIIEHLYDTDNFFSEIWRVL